MTLAEYLNEKVRENNLSIRDVSDRGERARKTTTGLSTGYIHSMMSGDLTDPPVSTVMALAVGLGVPAQEVFNAMVNSLTESYDVLAHGRRFGEVIKSPPAE